MLSYTAEICWTRLAWMKIKLSMPRWTRMKRNIPQTKPTGAIRNIRHSKETGSAITLPVHCCSIDCFSEIKKGICNQKLAAIIQNVV